MPLLGIYYFNKIIIKKYNRIAFQTKKQRSRLKTIELRKRDCVAGKSRSYDTILFFATIHIRERNVKLFYFTEEGAFMDA